MFVQKEYNRRYNLCFALCQKLLSRKLRLSGKESDPKKTLIESVIASAAVTELIMTHPFSEEKYQRVIIEEIEKTRKLFFPDLAKKRFVTLDYLSSTYHSDPNINFLNDKLTISYDDSECVENPEQQLNLILSGNSNNLKHDVAVKERISLIKKLYSDGCIPDISAYNVLNKLTKQQITDIYKNVLSGAEKKYPENFLIVDGKERSAVIVRYLLQEIKDLSSPGQLLQLDEAFFIEHKLLNVLRFFNYSLNKILVNAFPDTIKPWCNGRINDQYWNKKENRVEAVKWLVNKQGGADLQPAGKISLSRRDFSRNGLSYLYNTYYNSVSKALQEACPQLKTWQRGPVPASYWTKDNTADALNFMFSQLNWSVPSLPQRYNSKQLTRKTFSNFGLSGLYEKHFKCNIYKLLDFVYPAVFKPWQFGTVTSVFWQNARNREQFSDWYLTQPPPGRGKLHGVYASLNRNYKGGIEQLMFQVQRDKAELNKSRLLLKKLQGRIKNEQRGLLSSFLVYGLFWGLVQQQTRHDTERLSRIKLRLRKNLSEL